MGAGCEAKCTEGKKPCGRDLLETAKRYEGAVREPLVNQGAMTIAIEFLNNLMGRMAEKQNQQAILSIMEFIDLLIGHGGLSSENVEELLHLTAQGTVDHA